MTNQEEQKLRETIDSLLSLQDLDDYLKEIASNECVPESSGILQIWECIRTFSKILS